MIAENEHMEKVLFTDLQLATVQGEIRECIRGGVYQFTNLRNRRGYLGSAATGGKGCNSPWG